MRAAALVFFALATVWPAAPEGLIGLPAPEVMLYKRDGSSIRLKDTKGRLRLIDAWAPWCGPCRNTLPHVQAIYEKFHARGLDVIGVNINGHSKEADALAEKLKLTFQILSDKPRAGDRDTDFDGPFGKAFRLNAIPHTVILAPDDTVLYAGHPSRLEDSHIEDALKGKPITITLTAGELISQAKKASGAEKIDLLLRALKAKPDDFQTLHDLGLAYNQQKRFPEALEALNRARPVTNDPGHIYEHLAEVYAASNDPASAIQQYELAAKSSPDNEERLAGIHHALGKIYSVRGQNDKAMAEFREALARAGEVLKEAAGASKDEAATKRQMADYYIHIGRIHRSERDYGEAARAFRQAEDTDPSDGDAYYFRGTALIELEKYDEAVEELRIATRIQPDDPENLHLLGVAYERLKKYQESAATFAKAVDLAPGQEHFKEHLTKAQARLREGNLDGVLRFSNLFGITSADKVELTVEGVGDVKGELAEGELTFHGLKEMKDGIYKAYLNGTERVYLERDGAAMKQFQPYGKSYAVIFANGAYSVAKNGMEELSYATGDGQKIEQYLKTEGFQTKLIPNATKQQIEDAFRDVSKNFTDLSKNNDRLLVYFIGHGLEQKVGNEMVGYFVPIDGNKNDPYSLIPMQDLKNKHSLILKAKHVLFALDSCYATLAAIRQGAELDTVERYREYHTDLEKPGRAILTAGDVGESAAGVPLQGSFFNQFFLKGLQERAADTNKDGIVTMQELETYLRSTVPVAAGQKDHIQRPRYHRMLDGEIGSGQFIFLVGRK